LAISHELEVQGAREHNLKNIDLIIPTGKLVVFTGLSGSGKSSLAFDTIFAEGQRRYLETLSAYARQFIGDMKRPDVDKINGLCPVIAIEQKTVSKNPRSTVGTITEIYDFLRLMFARTADAYSHVTGNRMLKFNEDEVIEKIIETFKSGKIIILAPLVKGRKGHYRELFESWIKKGYRKMRIDGDIKELASGMRLNRNQIHDVELVVDRFEPGETGITRIKDSVKLALKLGKGVITVVDTTENKEHHFSLNLMDPESGLSYDEPEPNTFSFNSPYGACKKCNGIGTIHEVSVDAIIPDKSKSLMRGAVVPLGEYRENMTFAQIKGLGKKFGFSLSEPVSQFSDEILDILLNGTDEEFKISYTNYEFKKVERYSDFKGIVSIIEEQFYEGRSEALMTWAEEFMQPVKCPECEGTRLKKEALFFKIDGLNIAELANKSVSDLADWLTDLESRLSARQLQIGSEVLKEIRSRMEFLSGVGLDYLSLNSPASTLSGGEAQRIRLASQIGSKLVNVLYILDEPSIGLHQRDNLKLIQSLKKLRDMGNSVIVVEHDHEMIAEADYVVDIGPLAGVHGGKIVSAGNFDEFCKSNSLTAQYITGEKSIEIPKARRKGNVNKITLKGCTGNNLKDVTAHFPLGKFIVVTGVSGSGKSSLINETLYPILAKSTFGSRKKPLPYKSADGLKHIDKVIRIDQNPIGRTPRSNPATYTGVFSDIRNLFTQMPESKIRGYKPGRYSFNVKGGRCETCKGGGKKIIEMNFLPDVEVTCETCQGKRYNRETLEVRYKGKNISNVLDMSIEDACHFFEHIPSIHRKLKTIKDVGLGYITLGQSSVTLSGGEAQRVKLSEELSRKDTGNTFYILDEPTTGLHFEDIKILLDVLHKLTDSGNTVLVIEHNLDVIKCADYIIDLGPEGGNSGGQILCEGTPEQVVKKGVGYTSQFLKTELEKAKSKK
jgi:excinuclease ABC subunit A